MDDCVDSIAVPQNERPVEEGVYLSRANRRRLRGTGAVNPLPPNLSEDSVLAAQKLWASYRGFILIVIQSLYII